MDDITTITPVDNTTDNSTDNTLFRFVYPAKGIDYTGHIDMLDAEDAQRVTDAMEYFQSAGRDIPKDGTTVDSIKIQHGVFSHLFDMIFGEGEGAKVVGTSANLRVAYDAYNTLLRLIDASHDDMNEMAVFGASLAANRQQRRAMMKVQAEGQQIMRSQKGQKQPYYRHNGKKH